MNCALCGLESRDRFCCTGCANVYTILEENGVIASGQDFRQTDLYRESLRLGLIARPDAGGSKPVIPPGAEVRESVLHVSGMWCGSCAWLIERALSREPGIVSAEVFFASDLLKVRYCPQYVPPGRIAGRVAALGYSAGSVGGREREDTERRDLLLRMGIAGFLWLNVMTLSFVLYVGYFEHIAASVRRFLPLVLMGLSAPAVFYSAWPVLRVAAIGLRNRVLRMETLLALGILAAWGSSAAAALSGGRHVYFDTACAIVTLVLAGKLIERSAKERTARAVTVLHSLMPTKARLLVDGIERFVSIGALEPDRVFVVKPGERIPADGVVVDGRSHVDESVLTGESAPVGKAPGDTVIGGAVNAGGVLHVRATRVGAESTLARIIQAVESALGTRCAIERTVDRVARVFVPAVIGIAALTFAGWILVTHDPGIAWMRAIAVVVIACPCALGLATPLAITAAVGAASARGILVRDSRVLETIRKVGLVVFDKTGTVTEGDFALREVEGDPEALRLAASLEAYSEHPLARALAGHAREQGWPLEPATGIEVRPGMGITGLVSGRRVFVGNRRMAGIPGAHAWERQGYTVAYFGCDGQVRGALAFGDRIRDGASDVIAALHARGIRTLIVSGDTEAATAWVAAKAGAAGFAAETLPEQKIEIVRQHQRCGRTVAMIGDGVNDAPALAQADLGIAMGSGTDIAMKAAPMVLTSASLGRVLDAFDLASRAMRVVRQNLFWAFFYNCAAISLAVAGVLNPIMAAGAMVLSSVSVIANSSRAWRMPRRTERRSPERIGAATPALDHSLESRRKTGPPLTGLEKPLHFRS